MITVPPKTFAIILGGALFRAFSMNSKVPLYSKFGKISLTDPPGVKEGKLDFRAERKLYPHESFQIVRDSDWSSERTLLDTEFKNIIFTNYFGQLKISNGSASRVTAPLKLTPVEVVAAFLSGMEKVGDNGDTTLVQRTLRPNLEKTFLTLGLRAHVATGLKTLGSALPQWSIFLTSYHLQRVLSFLRDKDCKHWIETVDATVSGRTHHRIRHAAKGFDST